MALNHNSHDDRVLEALTNRSVPAEDHLLVCAPCREERDRLETSIGVFSVAAREATDRPVHFWTRQAAQIHANIAAAPTRRLSFGSRMVSALALLGLCAFLLLQGAPRPQAPVDSQVHSAATNSDHELLLAVEQALQRDTPAALEPVTLLVEDMTRATPDGRPGVGSPNFGSPRFTKEQLRHVN